MPGPAGWLSTLLGNLYVANKSADTITEYDSAGTLIRTISGGFIQGPTALAVNVTWTADWWKRSSRIKNAAIGYIVGEFPTGDPKQQAVFTNGGVYVRTPWRTKSTFS
jgi:hypothetical protein